MDLRFRMPEALISSDPKIMMGKPTITGSRITVELILEKLAAGETVDQILSEHPRLTAEGIRAAIAFAAEALRADVVYPAEKVAGEDRCGRKRRQTDCRPAPRPELDPGIDDEAVLLQSRQSNAILLTADKDFGELVFRQHLLHSGILLIRIAGLRGTPRLSLWQRLLNSMETS